MKEKKYAFTTVCSDDFLEGGMTLIWSFLQTNKWFNGDVIVFCDEGKYCPLGKDSRKKLEMLDSRIKVYEIESSKYQKAIDNATECGVRTIYHESIIYKTEIFNLKDYDTAIFFDADVLIVGDIKSLLDATDENIAGFVNSAKTDIEIDVKGDEYFAGGVIIYYRNGQDDTYYDDIMRYYEDYKLEYSIVWPVCDRHFYEEEMLDNYFGPHMHMKALIANHRYNTLKTEFDQTNRNIITNEKAIHYMFGKPWEAKGNTNEYIYINNYWFHYNKLMHEKLRNG